MQLAKTSILLTIVILIVAILGGRYLIRYFFTPTESSVADGLSSNTGETVGTSPVAVEKGKDIEVITENLDIPWEIGFTPGGDMLITERSGNLLKIGNDKKVIKIEGVYHIGEGGLLGLALDPNFGTNNIIYLYSTTRENGQIQNRVERYKLNNDKLTDRKVVLSGIKGSSNHDGGRIKFGPDGYLYVATGDAENPQSAQDKSSLNGKILRITTEGQPVPDNPFGNSVYSYGHRNIQGITWDNKGNLWATEHGPSGAQTGNDEINLIKKGANYGWPEIKGVVTKAGMETPAVESGRTDTWAPGGIVYFKDNLFFAGLRGEALYQAKINSETSLLLTQHFKREYGRIRTITIGPDGYFYILTSNKDGRGNPQTGDDKLIKINPEIFF